MSERLVPLTEAVKDLLNSATWSQTFTAVRTAVPKYEAKTGTLEVRVRPVDSKSNGPRGRKTKDRDYTIDIIVLKKVEIADNTQTDPLIDLAEEIAQWFEDDDDGHPRNIQTAPLPRAWVTSVESVPAAYAWEYAVEDQFVAIRRLNVKCIE